MAAASQTLDRESGQGRLARLCPAADTHTQNVGRGAIHEFVRSDVCCTALHIDASVNPASLRDPT